MCAKVTTHEGGSGGYGGLGLIEMRVAVTCAGSVRQVVPHGCLGFQCHRLISTQRGPSLPGVSADQAAAHARTAPYRKGSHLLRCEVVARERPGPRAVRGFDQDACCIVVVARSPGGKNGNPTRRELRHDHLKKGTRGQPDAPRRETSRRATALRQGGLLLHPRLRRPSLQEGAYKG